MDTITAQCAKCGTTMPAKVCPSCGWERRGPVEQVFRFVLVVGLAFAMLFCGLFAFALITAR